MLIESKHIYVMLSIVVSIGSIRLTILYEYLSRNTKLCGSYEHLHWQKYTVHVCVHFILVH